MKFAFILIAFFNFAFCQLSEFCDNPGECVGSSTVGHASDVASVEECRQSCVDHLLCAYFTWYADDNTCLLFADCDGYDEESSCQNCPVELHGRVF